MKRYKQGHEDRVDESLGMSHPGPHKQSLKDRRHESEAMGERYDDHMKHAHHKYMANHYRRRNHKRK